MEIRIRGLSRYYYSEGKQIKALDNVDLTIPANKIFTLLGPSGCGKTTLLRCIVGLEVPDSGEIYIGDELVWSSEKKIFVDKGPGQAVHVFCFLTLRIHRQGLA